MFWIPATEFVDLLEAADRNHPPRGWLSACSAYCEVARCSSSLSERRPKSQAAFPGSKPVQPSRQ